MIFSQYYQYSFIALICLGLLIQNYINMRRYGHQTLSGRYLLAFVLTVASGCMLEILYGLRESGLFGNSNAIGYVETRR